MPSRGRGASRRGEEEEGELRELQTCICEGPGASNATKIPREGLQRGKNTWYFGRERAKMRNVGPARSTRDRPTRQSPTRDRPHFSCSMAPRNTNFTLTSGAHLQGYLSIGASRTLEGSPFRVTLQAPLEGGLQGCLEGEVA